jgi:hypothetical protein
LYEKQGFCIELTRINAKKKFGRGSNKKKQPLQISTRHSRVGGNPLP